MTNLERATRGLEALRNWVGTDVVDEANLSDMLGDLMHLARLSKTRTAALRLELGEYGTQLWDFESELDRARSHFDEEKLHAWNTEDSGF